MSRNIRLPRIARRYRLLLALGIATALGGFLLLSEHPAIWPVRNTLLYRADRWWREHVADEQPAGTGAFYGCVRDVRDQPAPQAMVLVAEPDGRLHRAEADQDGCYRLDQIPEGRYVPMATAPGLGTAAVRSFGRGLGLDAGEQRRVDISLPLLSLPAVGAAADLQIGEPVSVSRDLPEPGTAVRREVRFNSAGQANQQTLLYTPVGVAGRLPTLLAIYPGPAESWEGVSIPLAAAGYAVIAAGPAYSLDLEADVAELQRLVALARAGALPGVDGRRMAVLGGSYSSLHVLRLLQRDADFNGAVLLGAAGDLFDLRRRFEEGSFFPPFDLDQALIALGWPNTAPERYWRYSGIYHLQENLPPMLLMHSRDDEVVPYQQSEQLAAALERLSVPYEAHFFDGMSHYLNTGEPSEDLDRLYRITLTFLDRTLIQQ